MIDEYQFVLEPALQSVKDLRSAYRRDVQRDREECDNRLRVALAKIERREVRHCVDGYLADLGGPITLDRRWRSELLEKEAELSALVGRGGDRKIIKRALAGRGRPRGDGSQGPARRGGGGRDAAE